MSDFKKTGIDIYYEIEDLNYPTIETDEGNDALIKAREQQWLPADFVKQTILDSEIDPEMTEIILDDLGLGEKK
jgi:hypothetical protein